MAATVDQLLKRGRHRLAQAPNRPPLREASLLLGRVLGLSEAQILARGERPIQEGEERRFDRLIERRADGEPVAYLLGEREFYGREFFVDSRVLIPRPETEHLVEEALALELPPRPRLLDLGTGSGCLAVTLALELDGDAVAIDRSPGALAVARTNIERHCPGRVRLLGGDLAGALRIESFDLVVSNPPYIGADELPTLSTEVRDFEPRSALQPPGAADSVIARLLGELEELRSGVPLVFEIGYLQGDRVGELAASGAFELEKIRRDYAGHPRIAVCTRRPSRPK